MFMNSIPLKEPLLKAYLGASHIVEEASIHGDLQGLESLFRQMQHVIFHGLICLLQVEQTLHPVGGVWILLIYLVSANFQQAWHQIPDVPGFAATHFREGLKFVLGVEKIAEAKLANPV